MSAAATAVADYERGRLGARPGESSDASGLGPGAHPVPIGGAREEPLLFVPRGLDADRPAALIVMAHGANGAGKGSIDRLDEAVGRRALILAPTSEEHSWDMIYGGFGVDVERLDQALAWTFDRFTVDPSRLAMAGFSDGASWALSVGLANGDLFSHVIGYSPGFLGSDGVVGRPKVFISHGELDRVLPPASTSRPIVEALRGHDYVVRYVTYPAKHTLLPGIARQGVDWFFRTS